MGYLDELLARIDSARRTVGRNVSDMATNPSLYAEKVVGALRNQNAGVAPVIAGGELANRPLTTDERVSDAIDNLAGAGITKAVKVRPLTVFEQRHLTAQKNAALPVEKGGLGLPPNNTAMDRARAMGFDTPAYHATLADVDKFKKNKVTAYGDRFFFSPDANYANEFAPLDSTIAGHTDKVKAWKEKNAGGAGQNIMPVMLKSEAMKDWTHISPEYVVKDPSAIRSRFAAFDPMRRHEADIMGFADPYLLAGIGSGGLLASLTAHKLRNHNE